uniref:Uncharacterized protein n=1 Tax=mine drainage metagenome TaxID=410659 RepID=E6Q7N2_9ZZZZ
MQNDDVILGLDDAVVRDVFAHYGRALYLAHCLERSIAGTLLHVEWRANLKGPMTPLAFQESGDEFFAKLEKMPMGRLIGRLKNQDDVPLDLRTALDECNAARNVLVHYYFWNRAGEIALDAGQRKMIKECDEFCTLFERTDQTLMDYVAPYAERHGISKEALQAELVRVFQDAQANLELDLEQ